MATSLTRRRLRLLATFLVAGCLIGPVLNLTTSSFSIGGAIQGAVDGLLVATLVGSWQLFMREGRLRAWFRRRSFLLNFAINGSVMVLLFLLARAIGNGITGHPSRFVSSFYDRHLLVALPIFAVAVFAFQFGIQMSRMIGTNVLRYFVAGIYHRPKSEERVFLFLDLVGSTRLAEMLGSARYYELLRRFVDDLSEPILKTRGEIYQYAGDEVVITWRHDRAIEDANCVRCFFEINDAIEANADGYKAAFGVVPEFRAGLHGGEVVAGELGDLKQEIVFVGDILNTAARLEEYAKRAGERLTVSGVLLDRLTLPAGLRAHLLEDLNLRGKREKVEVHAVRVA